jgi:hypothetical protein
MSNGLFQRANQLESVLTDRTCRLQNDRSFRTAIAAIYFAYSYLLMLVAMTYSYGLFISLVVGYAIAFMTITHSTPQGGGTCH